MVTYMTYNHCYESIYYEHEKGKEDAYGWFLNQLYLALHSNHESVIVNGDFCVYVTPMLGGIYCIDVGVLYEQHRVHIANDNDLDAICDKISLFASAFNYAISRINGEVK